MRNVFVTKNGQISSFRRGFTLVELLVVIAILGILAAIGVSSFQNSQVKGRDAQRKHDLNQIQKALEMYYNDYKGYPPAVSFGVTWQDTNGTIYMKTVPNDPMGGSYCYESNVGGTWYKLYAKLENSQDSAIAKSGCAAGCACGSLSDYSYKVTSSNAP